MLKQRTKRSLGMLFFCIVAFACSLVGVNATHGWYIIEESGIHSIYSWEMLGINSQTANSEFIISKIRAIYLRSVEIGAKRDNENAPFITEKELVDEQLNGAADLTQEESWCDIPKIKVQDLENKYGLAIEGTFTHHTNILCDCGCPYDHGVIPSKVYQLKIEKIRIV
jgi:hypothetical protein